VKKWKIILGALLFILIIGAGTVYYFLNIKEYDTADKEVQEIVNSDYDIALPGEKESETLTNEGTEENNKTNQESEQATEENSESQNSVTSANTTNKSGTNTNNNTSSTSDNDQKPTADSIIKKYTPTFSSLESQAEGKIDSLLSHAYAEYQTKKANNEDISYFYFYSKYNSSAKQLEAGTDATFNLIYNAMVKELKSAGYSEAEAKSVKDHYNSVKGERRSSILSTAMAKLK
jgi:ABC-type cobalt transport system substrate-binding protein